MPLCRCGSRRAQKGDTTNIIGCVSLLPPRVCWRRMPHPKPWMWRPDTQPFSTSTCATLPLPVPQTVPLRLGGVIAGFRAETTIPLHTIRTARPSPLTCCALYWSLLRVPLRSACCVQPPPITNRRILHQSRDARFRVCTVLFARVCAQLGGL